LLIKNVDEDAPKEAYVRFLIESNYDQVFHFFKWEYWNIWKFYEHIPLAYSKISGVVSPETLSRKNKNITTAFKGPESTIIFYSLTPTHYENEIDGQNYEGYQVFVEEIKRGSMVNKRTMNNIFLSNGEGNQGFDLELVTSVGQTTQKVEIHRIRSLIEVIAYIFGFIAGFVIVSHILKHFLSKEEYFKGLEREWNTLFGALEGSTFEKTPYSRPESRSEVEVRESRSEVEVRDFEYNSSNINHNEEVKEKSKEDVEQEKS